MRKVASLFLCLAVLTCFVIPVFAAGEVSNAGDSGDTFIQLTADATMFNVTVPTSIPIVVDKDVNVHCPNNLLIVNNSAGPVEVKGIELQNNEWSLTSYNNGNREFVANEKVDSDKIGFALTPKDGSISQTDKEGTQSLAIDFSEWVIACDGSNLPFSVAAISTAVSQEITTPVNAVNVVFTIGWNTVHQGIYYNRMYSATIDSDTVSYLLYEDGSYAEYVNGFCMGRSPSGLVDIVGNTIAIDGEVVGEVLQNGKAVDLFDTVLTLEPEKEFHGIYFERTYSYLDESENLYSMILCADGSVKSYKNGVFQSESPAGYLSYDNGVIYQVDIDDVVAYPYFDGTKILDLANSTESGEAVWVLEDESRIRFEEPYAISGGNGEYLLNTISLIFHSDGSFEQYLDGAVVGRGQSVYYSNTVFITNSGGLFVEEGAYNISSDGQSISHNEVSFYTVTTLKDMVNIDVLPASVGEQNKLLFGYTGEENEDLTISEFFVGADGITYRTVAFMGVHFTNLRSIYLPSSLLDIPPLVLEDCTGLTDIYFAGTEEQWNTINRASTSATIHFNYVP